MKNIPVAAGADSQPKSPLDWQIQYRRHPTAIYNRTLKPVKESAVELMARLLCDKMSDAFELDVPLVVDVRAGPNWDEMERLEVPAAAHA